MAGPHGPGAAEPVDHGRPTVVELGQLRSSGPPEPQPLHPRVKGRQRRRVAPQPPLLRHLFGAGERPEHPLHPAEEVVRRCRAGRVDPDEAQIEGVVHQPLQLGLLPLQPSARDSLRHVRHRRLELVPERRRQWDVPAGGDHLCVVLPGIARLASAHPAGLGPLRAWGCPWGLA